MKSQLMDGSLLGKDNQRFEVLGALDELSAQLSLLICALDGRDVPSVELVLEELQCLAAELAACDGAPLPASARLERLYAARDELFDHAPRAFVSFCGCSAAAQTNLARAVCRRAERELVRLALLRPGEVADEQLLYLDVLSDWLFLFACKLMGAQPRAPI